MGRGRACEWGVEGVVVAQYRGDSETAGGHGRDDGYGAGEAELGSVMDADGGVRVGTTEEENEHERNPPCA